jgi:hypothetical protein
MVKRVSWFLLILGLTILSVNHLLAQEVKIGFGLGQSMMKGEQSKERVAGPSYQMLYEYQPYRSPIAFGFTASFLQAEAPFTRPNGDFTEQLRIIPVAFVPKLMFSEYDSKAFVKGMIGAQQTQSIVRGDGFNRKNQEYGFYGGVGAGVELGITNFLFALIEYDLTVVGSRLLNSPVIHTGKVSLGVKFN